MKKYVINFIKSRLPLFIVVVAVLSIVGFVSAISLNFIEHIQYRSEYSQYIYITIPEDAGISGLAFTTCIIAALLPLINMNFHYSLSKTDLFRQTAQNKKSYRYVDHGISVGLLVASYTIAFLIFLFTLAIKNGSQPIPENTLTDTYYKVYYNFAPYFFVYLLTVLFIIGNYFINYLFISRSSNLANSIILMILGQAFMGFFPVLFAEFERPVLRFFLQTPLCNSSVSFGPLFLDYRYTGWIINGDKSYMNHFYNNGDSLTEGQAIRFTTYSFILFFSVAILGLIAFFLEKEQSGEFAGKPENKKPYQEICYNLFMGATFTVFFFWMLKEWNDTSAGSVVFLLLTFMVVYYVLYGVLRRNFKPQTYQIIVMVANTALLVIVGLIIYGCIGFTPVEY